MQDQDQTRIGRRTLFVRGAVLAGGAAAALSTRRRLAVVIAQDRARGAQGIVDARSGPKTGGARP